MDEIGMMVADIDERGFVRFTTIGGFDDRVFPAQEVYIHGREKVFGVIGVKPPHILPPENAKKAFKAEDLFIDTGYGREKLLELMPGHAYGYREEQIQLAVHQNNAGMIGAAVLAKLYLEKENMQGD
jgi:putative aminopeptidase FrvX